MNRWPVSLVLVLATAACGGSIEDSAPAEKPSTGTNSPSNVPVGGGCSQACDRLISCAATGVDGSLCVRDCRRDFADEMVARTFASCLTELSCDTLKASMSMGYGPIGECYDRARGR